MTSDAPLISKLNVSVPAAAALADAETDVAIAPFAGTISSVVYVAATTLTGAATNSRTGVLVNKGAGGAGSVTPATLAFLSGVNATADEQTPITLSATASDLVVAAGDILVWQSNHVGGSGLADPGGLLHIELSRS